ncbi:hypothetical protein [Candidatus Parabeggiatoa sp. HSG14]|uniref:hypothetical protein n=1 Tax=Candidatus Parabeggiatoa sp. HSG14 TaxID=3055593 RepID=UPI0025A6EAA9|nr:hypothetical protein [Thiotrichales bacterium HSG14]
MVKESTLEGIWETRRRIYAKCDNDPVKLVQYYIARQKANPERFASSKIATPKTVEQGNR